MSDFHNPSEYPAATNSSRAKHWCFTLNNYTDEDERQIENAKDSGSVLYLIYGKEVGASGTPHLQGFVSFRGQKRLQEVVRLVGQAHYSVARNIPRAIEYCKKEGNYRELGTSADVLAKIKKAGTRNDLESFQHAVRGGMHDLKELREAHPGVMARYPRFCLAYVRDHKPRPSLPPHQLFDWQQEIVDAITLPPDSRTIFFIVDKEGNSGKSFLCQYLETNHEAQVMKCGKRDDMAFELDDNPKLVCIDVSRCAAEYLNYQFLEDLKDGRVFSPKYESYTKRFNPPHVVVFMNEYPKVDKLSRDRWEGSVKILN